MAQDEIDHKDRDPSNDIWENLRGATSSDNKCNRRTHSASGLKGIDWYAPLAKWRVRVNENHVGYYADVDEAVLARDSAAIAWQGDFAFLISQENQSDS
jgi:hypothetical protein